MDFLHIYTKGAKRRESLWKCMLLLKLLHFSLILLEIRMDLNVITNIWQHIITSCDKTVSMRPSWGEFTASVCISVQKVTSKVPLFGNEWSLWQASTSCEFFETSACVSRKGNQNWPHITGGDWYYCSHIQSSFIGVTARFFLKKKWLCNRALPRRCVTLGNDGCLLRRLIEFTWQTWLLKDWWCLSLLQFRVRVFDLRTASSVASLYAHHLGVTAVQADDWKIVSGGGEGLVCVWELRMRAKLWEMHNRWVFSPLYYREDGNSSKSLHLYTREGKKCCFVAPAGILSDLCASTPAPW